MPKMCVMSIYCCAADERLVPVEVMVLWKHAFSVLSSSEGVVVLVCAAANTAVVAHVFLGSFCVGRMWTPFRLSCLSDSVYIVNDLGVSTLPMTCIEIHVLVIGS